MIRFNAKGEFNLPVGNVDFNQNVLYALNNYFNFVAKRKIYFYNQDFRIFLKNLESEILALKNSKIFIYFDPPYLIGGNEYNKYWNEESEIYLYEILYGLDSLEVHWGLSNILKHKGRENTLLKNFMKCYKVHEVQSNI